MQNTAWTTADTERDFSPKKNVTKQTLVSWAKLIAFGIGQWPKRIQVKSQFERDFKRQILCFISY